jgi:hypothetical protein
MKPDTLKKLLTLLEMEEYLDTLKAEGVTQVCVCIPLR